MSEATQSTGETELNNNQNSGEWKVVDDRLFECPNGHGLLEVESASSVWCPDCGYSRPVFEYVKDE